MITIERMRADVAEIIGEEPDSIGYEDNLIDLGLDSMRLLNLILEWQQDGLNLEFVEIAERSTLAGWWEAIELKRQAAAG